MKRAVMILLLFICLTAGAAAKNYEFINQKVEDVLYIFSTELKTPIITDTTVSGIVSFQFAGADARTAFEAFLEANRLFSYEDDGIYHVSKIQVTKNPDGSINVSGYDATAGEIIERIGGVTKTTITYEMLPGVKHTIGAENVSVKEALEIVLRPYSEYEIIEEEKYIYIKRSGAASMPEIADAASRIEIEKDDETGKYRGYITKGSLQESLRRLFELEEKEYTSFITHDMQIEHIQYNGRSFKESLELLLCGGGARAVEKNGMWYILPEEKAQTQETLKRENEKWERYTLSYHNVADIRTVIEARYPYIKLYDLPDAKTFTAAVAESDRESFNEFIQLLDRPSENQVIKLKYIQAEDLMQHLPPSVKADDIVRTGNNAYIFYKGSPEKRELFIKELEKIDIPQKRIRYDMLIVQYQQSSNMQWSMSFEGNRLKPGNSTLLTGMLGGLLNLNFDVITVFGYLFALKFNTALAENKASIFADTTLHGVSGQNIQFKNTSTYRYRDSTIDPDTGKPQYTGVTREIISGLILDINGWVSGDGMITTTVTASVSKQGVDVSSKTGNPPPTTEKMITTQVRSRSGEPVILSGLAENDMTASDEGLPFLARIPILNKLFSSILKTEEQSEMVIYLVPHLEKDCDEENETLNLTTAYEKYGEKIWRKRGAGL